MISAPDCDALRQLLLDEEALASRLLAVLETEYAAVTERDASALEKTLKEKQNVISDLEGRHGTVAVILARVGLAADQPGMEEALRRCSAPALEQAWKAMRTQLVACEKQNTVNGKLLESSRRVTQQALSILLGVSPDSGELYTQKGKAVAPALGGRTVTKA